MLKIGFANRGSITLEDLLKGTTSTEVPLILAVDADSTIVVVGEVFIASEARRSEDELSATSKGITMSSTKCEIS